MMGAAARFAFRSARLSGQPYFIGPVLPPDPSDGRVGAVDLLIRGADRPDGSAGYHPVEVKWHKLHERRTLTARPRPNTSLLLGRLDRPKIADAVLI